MDKKMEAVKFYSQHALRAAAQVQPDAIFTCPILQIICREKSLRCTPRGTPPAPGALQVYHDFAEKNVKQWGNLLSRVQVYLTNKRNELGSSFDVVGCW